MYKLIARICALYKAYTGGRRGRGDHNLKIRTRKQRTDVGKYSFINRTIRNWNQLTASLLASFPRKLNTFRKRVKNVVTSKGFSGEG